MNEQQERILKEVMQFAVENNYQADIKDVEKIRKHFDRLVTRYTEIARIENEAIKTQLEVVKDASAQVLAEYLITIGELEQEISGLSAKAAEKDNTVRSEADMAHEWLTKYGMDEFNGKHRPPLIKRIEGILNKPTVKEILLREANKWLDDRQVPRTGPEGQNYTLIGRIEHYKFSMPRTGKNPMIEEALLKGEDTTGLCTVREAVEVMRENKSHEMELFYQLDEVKYNVIISFVEVAEGA